MFASQLLQLRSNAPGMPGPYLLENIAPYQVFDSLGRFNSILAIGGQSKARHLEISFSQTDGVERRNAVTLDQVGDDLILFDCELHSQPDTTILRVTQEPQCGSTNLHPLKSAPRRVAEIAWGIYSGLLSPFSDVVLIFVSDVGGLSPVIDFLTVWLHRAMFKVSYYPVTPHVILIADEGEPRIQMPEIYNRLISKVAAHLRVADPLRGYSAKDIRQVISNCLRLSTFSVHDGSIRDVAEKELEKVHVQRIAKRWDFSAVHTRELLHLAVAQYAERPWAFFDFIAASRHKYPLPNRLNISVTSFLRNFSVVSNDEVSLVASALVLDAYPTQMHRESAPLCPRLS